MSEENLDQQAKSRTEISNETLEAAKGKYDEVLVVGLRNGVLDLTPSIPTYIFNQYLLSRAVFELNIAEKAQTAEKKN